MSEKKHTQGEWRPVVARNKVGDSFPGYWTVESGNVRVADLFGEVIGEQDENGDDAHIPDAEVEANAHLIAAAPAMRHRLEFAHRLLLQGDAEGALREIEHGLAGEYER